MNSDPICPPLRIPKDALVLDVGSGHRPHPRADILCDKSLVDNTERGKAAVVDRPLVIGDAQSLPFRPNSFDYIIARHILEHVDDPVAFFHEIARVGCAGYIEAPTLIWEHLHPVRKYHKWVLVRVHDTIMMAPKPPALYESVLGSVMEELGMNSLEYGLLIKAYKDLFYIRHEWFGEIRFEVYPSLEKAPFIFRVPWNAEIANQWISPQSSLQQINNLLRNLVGSVVRWTLRGYFVKRERKQLQARLRRRPIDLRQLMMCPNCKSLSIELHKEIAQCRDCHWQTTVLMPQ